MWKESNAGHIHTANFIPSLVPDWKTAIWFFAICSKEPFLLPSVKTINRLSSCLQQATTVHNLYHVFKDCHHSKTFQVQMGIQKGSRKEMFWKPQSLVKPVVLIVVLKIHQRTTFARSNGKIQRKKTRENSLKISTNNKVVNSRNLICVFLVR